MAVSCSSVVRIFWAFECGMGILCLFSFIWSDRHCDAWHVEDFVWEGILLSRDFVVYLYDTASSLLDSEAENVVFVAV
jgi:hypothetical protein